MATAAVPASPTGGELRAGTYAAEPASAGLPAAGTIEVEFANGTRMRVTGAVDPAMLSAAVAVLTSGGRRR